MQTIANKEVDYKSKSGSSYFFTETGVYRLSNHWGRAANCKWRLQSNSKSSARTKLGYADWSAFCPDNETDPLYFITVNYQERTASYLHKNAAEYQSDFVLRSAGETTKIVKTIRGLFANNAWAKYYEGTLESLEQQVIHQLITTTKSIVEIKSTLPKNS